MTPERAPLLTLDDALARLIAGVSPMPTSEHETLSTFDALGRVLQQDLRSTIDVPPQDNSSMDGYAMRCADVSKARARLGKLRETAAGKLHSGSENA